MASPERCSSSNCGLVIQEKAFFRIRIFTYTFTEFLIGGVCGNADSLLRGVGVGGIKNYAGTREGVPAYSMDCTHGVRQIE